MYGMVNRSIEEFIVRQHGEAAWRATKKRASVDAEVFLSMRPYPDEVTYRLVVGACEELQLDADALLRDLGANWVSFAAKTSYGRLMNNSGETLPAFLRRLDALHSKVGMGCPELKPPSFRVKEIAEGELELQYFSKREGLQSFVIGLIRGLGERFGQDVEVDLVQPRGDGEVMDVFRVRHWDRKEAIA